MRKVIISMIILSYIRASSLQNMSEISLEANLDLIISKNRITKILINLRGCAGWSVPLLFANSRSQGFSCRGPFVSSEARCVDLHSGPSYSF